MSGSQPIVTSPGGTCRTPRTPKFHIPGAYPSSVFASKTFTPSKPPKPLAFLSSPATSSPTPSALPFFDTSTYNPLTFKWWEVPNQIITAWCRNPMLYVSGSPPDPKQAKTAKEYVRRTLAIKVSSAVFALGDNPYPGLRKRRNIPELGRMTPEYDGSRPWFSGSNILAHVTPAELENKGCININTTNPIFISRRFRLNAGHMATANKDKNASRLHGDCTGIHPCFKRSNWAGISDWQYEHLKPSLRVASKMLDMPSLLDMWSALASPLHKAPATDMKPEGSWVYYTGQSTQLEKDITAREMTLLGNYVTWHWGHKGDITAWTALDTTKTGLREGPTYPCDVTINEDILYILTGGTAYAARHYNPEASDGPSLLRTQFMLAMVLVHELTHVWFLNTTEIDEDVFPYANDERIGEEGHACEAVVIKSVNLRPIVFNPLVWTSPFGMRADPWPGVFGFEGLVRASRAKHGINRNTEYAVPMKFIRDFFTDDFWDCREKRFGAGAVDGYKAIGVRMKLTFDARDFDDLESPTVEKIRDEDTGLDIDTWMPDVEEGIIYPDKAFELSGAPIDIEM